LEVVARFDIHSGTALVQARIVGTYPDGSGANKVGTLLHATDRTAKGWFPPWDLRADGGVPEIIQAVERLPVIQAPFAPAELKKVFKYYGMQLD
jgi:hypothetical protein